MMSRDSLPILAALISRMFLGKSNTLSRMAALVGRSRRRLTAVAKRVDIVRERAARCWTCGEALAADILDYLREAASDTRR